MLVRQAIEEIFIKFDKDANNQLDTKEARAFVEYVLVNLYGENQYSINQFNNWFL